MRDDTHRTLLDAFEACLETAPVPYLVELIVGAGERVNVDSSELRLRAAQCAGRLTELGIVAGDRVVLSISKGNHFHYAFWGCQMIGAIAVPVAPLDNRGRLQTQIRHTLQIAEVARPSAAILQSDVIDLESLAELAAWPFPVIMIDHCLSAEPYNGPPARRDPEDIAFLQFTSGSTSAPKGCALSNRAALNNAFCVNSRLRSNPGDTNVHWIPLHHDMGLMGGVLCPVYGRMTSVMMSARQFMLRPLTWVEAMAGRRGVNSAVPNFGLLMTLQRADRLKLAPDALAGVANICCGAEPIDSAVAKPFLEALAPFGLRAETFHACYGMAETTVLATSRPGGLKSGREFLMAAYTSSPAERGEAKEYVSCGRAVPGAETRIVDADGRLAPDGVPGELQLRSASLFSAYFNNPQATADKFDGDWFRTGDQAFQSDGEIYVTGRLSDLIIVGGHNIFPRDIELEVSARTNVDARRIAAFSVEGSGGSEAIVIVIECRGSVDRQDLARRAAAACMAESGFSPSDVVFCAGGAIPKTTSGKVRRLDLRAAYIAGKLTPFVEEDLGEIAHAGN